MVLAVRGYNRPIVRPYAGAIVPDVHQIHSVDDRHPSQLPDGGTLIVGTGLSGVQIMEDLHFTGRPVHVAVGPAPRSPRKCRGRDATDLLSDMGHRAIIIDRYLDPVTALTQTNHAMSVRDGGKEDDLCGFALDGVRLCGSLAAAEGTRLRFQTDMETNLDDASRSDCGIRDPIDAWTYAEGVNAPPAPAFCKVWHPDQHRVAAAKAVRDAPDLAAPAVRRWQGLRRGDDDLDLRAPRSD